MKPTRPAIYPVIILPTLILGGIYITLCLTGPYAKREVIEISDIPNLAGILITVPAFILWIPIAFILSNIILVSVPGLRKVALKYASDFNLPDFAKSQL